MVTGPFVPLRVAVVQTFDKHTVPNERAWAGNTSEAMTSLDAEDTGEVRMIPPSTCPWRFSQVRVLMRTGRRNKMEEQELAFVRSQHVARLATIAADGTPSLVPICFALIDSDGPVIVSVLDDKPKSVPDEELARVRHIRREPRVSVIVDHYDEDWSRLAFVQIKGMARIVGPGDPAHATAIMALRSKYPQYHAMAVEQRPVMVIEPRSTTSWGI